MPAQNLYRFGAANMPPTIVARIETALVKAGFDPGPLDGAFGDRTDATVRAFQTPHGPVADASSAAIRRRRRE